MTRLLLSRLHHPVDNLGYGTRAAIWFQGCAIHCPGCTSVDTWRRDPETECEVDDVLAWVDGLSEDTVDGITISGGEPTDQPEALLVLLQGLAKRFHSRTREFDVLLYTGRELEELHVRAPGVLDLVDAVVSGRFIATLAGSHALRGSANQTVTAKSELGARRYPAADLERRYGEQRSRMGLHVDDQSIWMVGIPLPGTMSALTATLRERGVDITKESWLQ